MILTSFTENAGLLRTLNWFNLKKLVSFFKIFTHNFPHFSTISQYTPTKKFKKNSDFKSPSCIDQSFFPYAKKVAFSGEKKSYNFGTINQKALVSLVNPLSKIRCLPSGLCLFSGWQVLTNGRRPGESDTHTHTRPAKILIDNPCRPRRK